MNMFAIVAHIVLSAIAGLAEAGCLIGLPLLQLISLFVVVR
jgi:hypothetical protein